MLQHYPYTELGYANFDWLEARHEFPFLGAPPEPEAEAEAEAEAEGDALPSSEDEALPEETP